MKKIFNLTIFKSLIKVVEVRKSSLFVGIFCSFIHNKKVFESIFSFLNHPLLINRFNSNKGKSLLSKPMRDPCQLKALPAHVTPSRLS